MHFMYHTNEVVSPLCFDHLVPGSLFIKSTPMRSLCSRIRIFHDVSLVTRSSCFFVAECASTIEKYGSRCQLCSPVLTLSASGPAPRTTPQLDVTILMLALIALGAKVPRWTEATR